MSISPLLERDATRAGVFAFAGSVLRIETNSRAILSAARSTFTETNSSAAHSFAFKLYVHRQSTMGNRESCRDLGKQPYFRGRDHLVIAIYSGGAMLFDLLGCRAVGVFSEAMARNEGYWRRVILPVAIGVISASIGVVPLHCATLVRNGCGLHISGLSGVGKSTLAVALTKRGFALLSDDWTYFSRDGGGVAAYGVPVPVKLMPAAQQFFPELRGLSPAVSLNGERAFEVDPSEIFSAARAFSCMPQRIIFLDRRPVAQPEWLRLSPVQVENQFRPALERMPECLRSARDQQHAIIHALAQFESWSLVCGGDPHDIAEEIDRFIAATPAIPQFAARDIPMHFEIPDLMCRFVPSPFVADIAANGISIRLETDLPELFAQATTLPSPHPPIRPQFLCTVLKDDAVRCLAAAAACHDGMSFKTIPGATCQIADRCARRIVAFVTEAHAHRPAFLRELLELACPTGMLAQDDNWDVHRICTLRSSHPAVRPKRAE